MGGIGGAMSFAEDKSNIMREKWKIKENLKKIKEESAKIGTLLEYKTLSKIANKDSIFADIDVSNPTGQRTMFDSDLF
ncbi:unnamed protein product [Blepharisma stoltei]|uniref:Uncharacterized protein n=1 Tax=Blepharisma stoltei TaxID=1481888 RepID=A0AAU9IRD3_9CILI|nr:unnamed protein product [Blepharisma stoltei]